MFAQNCGKGQTNREVELNRILWLNKFIVFFLSYCNVCLTANGNCLNALELSDPGNKFPQFDRFRPQETLISIPWNPFWAHNFFTLTVRRWILLSCVCWCWLCNDHSFIVGPHFKYKTYRPTDLSIISCFFWCIFLVFYYNIQRAKYRYQRTHILNKMRP